MRCLVVVPAYNEEEALPKTLATLNTLPDYFDVLVVNDGSRDRTQEVAEKTAWNMRVPVHVVQLPMNGGIGVAVQTGFLFALKKGIYRYVLQFDADGTLLYNVVELDPVLREFAILKLSRLRDSDYQWVQHVAIARALGATGQQIAADGGLTMY